MMSDASSRTRRFSSLSKLRLWFRIAIFLLFLLIIVRMVEPALLQDVLAQVRLDVLGVGVLIYFGNIAIRAYRWKLIFTVRGQQFSYKDAYLVTLVGVALNMVIPATLGDVARSYYGYKIYGFKEEMFSTVLVDKMFALCSLFLMGGVSGYMLGYYALGSVCWVAAIITFVPVAWPGLVPWSWANAVLKHMNKSLDPDRLLDACKLPWSMKGMVMAISLLGWLCTCIYFYVICSAFPVQVKLSYVIVIMPVLTIVRLFPFTVNALGPMEVAVAYFFSQLGIHATLAVLVSLTSNLISSLIPGSLGVLVLLMVQKSSRNSQTVEEP